MSFLDDVPQDWSKPELRAVRDLLVLAYRRVDDAEQLANRSGIVPGTFPFAHNVRSLWTELISVMGNQGKLRRLVETAARDDSVAAFGPRLIEMLENQPAVAIPPPPAGSDGPPWESDALGLLQPQRLMERRSRLIDIELAAAVVSAAPSVVRLSLRFGGVRAYGTGFLINERTVLTNYHNLVHEEFGPVRELSVQFDHRTGAPKPPLVARGAVESVEGEPAEDWAVFQLMTPVEREPIRLGTPYDIGINDMVVIIQHPLGAFKQFALEPLAIRHVDGNSIQYVADTQDGSSGSPVFNEQMHVIAIHRAETALEIVVDGQRQTVWRNQGIQIVNVIRGLQCRGIAYYEND